MEQKMFCYQCQETAGNDLTQQEEDPEEHSEDDDRQAVGGQGLPVRPADTLHFLQNTGNTEPFQHKTHSLLCFLM